jgi:hypothetical protein
MDWILIAVVIIAFIAGYSVVGFIIKKIGAQNRTDYNTNGQSYNNTQEGKSKSAIREDKKP